MKKFKHPKANELFGQAQALERAAEEQLCYDSITYETYCDMMTTAAGLRVLADDIEAGVITPEELEGA